MLAQGRVFWIALRQVKHKMMLHSVGVPSEHLSGIAQVLLLLIVLSGSGATTGTATKVNKRNIISDATVLGTYTFC